MLQNQDVMLVILQHWWWQERQKGQFLYICRLLHQDEEKEPKKQDDQRLRWYGRQHWCQLWWWWRQWQWQRWFWWRWQWWEQSGLDGAKRLVEGQIGQFPVSIAKYHTKISTYIESNKLKIVTSGQQVLTILSKYFFQNSPSVVQIIPKMAWFGKTVLFPNVPIFWHTISWKNCKTFFTFFNSVSCLPADPVWPSASDPDHHH